MCVFFKPLSPVFKCVHRLAHDGLANVCDLIFKILEILAMCHQIKLMHDACCLESHCTCDP